MQLLIKGLQETGKGISVKTGKKKRIIPALLYADDVMLLSETREGIKELIKTYEDFCSCYRTSTNLDKTFYMVYQKDERDMSKMVLQELSEIDSEVDDEERTQTKRKVLKIFEKNSKVPFNQRIGIPLEDHKPGTKSEIELKKNKAIRVISKINNTWGGGMSQGVFGIIPEGKIRRVSKADYEIEKQNRDAEFRDPESKKDPLKLHGITIKRARVLKVVGTYIAQNGSEAYQQSQMIQKAARAWSNISHQMSKSRHFSIETWIKLWQSKVLTHLTYCISTWPEREWERVKILMNSHIRKILGLEAKSSVDALYDEIKLPDWNSLRKIRKLRLWGKIMKLPCSTITKQLYDYERKHLETSYWAKGIKAIMTEIKLEDWWNDAEIKTNKKTGGWNSYSKRLIIKQRECDIQNGMSRKKSLHLYKRFRVKKKKKRMAFLSSTDRAGARILLRIKSGMSDLEVAKERKIPEKDNRRPRNERRCRLCAIKYKMVDKENKILEKHKHKQKVSPEDMVHFLKDCKYFVKERNELIKKNKWTRLGATQLMRKLTGIEKKRENKQPVGIYQDNIQHQEQETKRENIK